MRIELQGDPVRAPVLSRRDFLKLAGHGVAAMALLTGCDTSSGDATSQSPTVQPTSSAQPPTPQLTQEAPPAPSLDVKIGQMLMVGFRGLEINEEHFVARDILERHLGGVVLFDYDVPTESPVRNVASPAQVEALVASLQSASPIPLLIAIDQEGGIVARLKQEHGFPPTVSHQRLGEIDDPSVTRDEAKRIAKTLAELGINLNLAPVVDLNINPRNPVIAEYERSFSADPVVVTDHAIEFIKAHHERNVLCTLKHFPGHGSSASDSHHGLVDVTETWSRNELEPYAEIIKAGLADAIMTAHVFNANLDADYPATLSHAVITGILRAELGYGGVVISDDMQMDAIARYYGFETAVQRAIEAGVDIITFANNSVYAEDVAARTAGLIRQLVEGGTISEARIDESYQRIDRLKSRLAPP